MARKKETPKIQHYVPQFLLRRFRNADTEQIWVFDKHEDRTFRTHVKNIAAEGRFYDVDVPDGSTISLEPSLGRLESSTADIIERMVAAKSVAGLSDDDKRLISIFVAVQFLRVRQWRSNLLDANKQLEGKLRAWGYDPSEVAMDEEDAKVESLRMLSEAEQFAPFIYGKDWFLFRSPDNRPFCISDSPVTLQNVTEQSFHRGGLGFASEGVEIHLPLSPSLSLAMYCPSNTQKIRAALEKYEEAKRHDAKLDQQLGHKAGVLADIYHGIETGDAVECIHDPADNLDSLQVMFSERFLFSSADSFEVARRMIADDPKFRHGLHMTVG